MLQNCVITGHLGKSQLLFSWKPKAKSKAKSKAKPWIHSILGSIAVHPWSRADAARIKQNAQGNSVLGGMPMPRIEENTLEAVISKSKI